MIKNKQTTIIYLIGKPGTGKYTIATELAKYGYIICDNQLANNPVFTLLNYDGFGNIPDFAWDAIKGIRDSIFEFLSKELDGNYVLTNVLYEDEGDCRLYSQVEQMASRRGSLFVPVKLLITEEENVRRITQISRRARWKSIDPQDAICARSLINISHPNLLTLDVTTLPAEDAATRILEHIHEIKS